LGDLWLLHGRANGQQARELEAVLGKIGLHTRLLDPKTRTFHDEAPSAAVLILSSAALRDAAFIELLARAATHLSDAIPAIRVLIDYCQDRVDELGRAIPEGPELPWQPQGEVVRAVVRISGAHANTFSTRSSDEDHITTVRWNDAPTKYNVVGRDRELDDLGEALGSEGPVRVLAIVGLGGIGKTALAVDLARRLSDHADAVLWVSLSTRRAVSDIEEELVALLGSEAPAPPSAGKTPVERLLNLLQARRLVLVLDNFESVLAEESAEYVSGYDDYARLLLVAAEADHQSRVIVTSREEPPPLDRLDGARDAVRINRLGALPIEVGRSLLQDHGLAGPLELLDEMHSRYDGNPLALQLVSFRRHSQSPRRTRSPSHIFGETGDDVDCPLRWSDNPS